MRVHKVIELLDVLSGRIEHEFHRVIAFYDLTILPFYSIAVLRYLLPVTSRELQEICHNTPLRDFLIKLIAIEAQDIERSFDDLGSVSLPDRSCKNSPNEIAADPPVIVAVKNSMKRRAAWSPAAAITRGRTISPEAVRETRGGGTMTSWLMSHNVT